MIEFRNVTKRFGEKTVLDKVDFEIFEGLVTTLIGKTGTGKSVLLKHIIGLLNPDEGDILFKGTPLNTMSRSEWNHYISIISYMFQNNALFDSLSVYDNIALPLKQTTRLSSQEIKHRVMARLEQAELEEMAEKYPSQLSGGMQKRVALARALVTDPQIVLFDEPTTGQDPIRRNAILSMIAEYKRKYDFTAVLISHDIPDVLFISNRILVLDQGRIIFQGTPKDLNDAQHAYLDEFVQSLEGFQEHLTGLYSRRSFKVRYQTALGRKNPHETFVLLVFILDDLDAMAENLSHTAVQAVLQELGAYINHHFGAVGGFSSRFSRDQFVTVLPFSNLKEAESILRDFVSELTDRGLASIQASAKISPKECFAFSVFVGLAQGKPSEEIDSVMQQAQARREPVARFQCITGGPKK